MVIALSPYFNMDSLHYGNINLSRSKSKTYLMGWGGLDQAVSRQAIETKTVDKKGREIEEAQPEATAEGLSIPRIVVQSKPIPCPCRPLNPYHPTRSGPGTTGPTKWSWFFRNTLVL
jgi:hypothetical protein